MESWQLNNPQQLNNPHFKPLSKGSNKGQVARESVGPVKNVHEQCSICFLQVIQCSHET